MPFSLAFFDDAYDKFYLEIDARNGAKSEALKLSHRNWSYFIDILADFIFFSDVFVTSFSAFFEEQEGVLVT